MNIPLDQLYNYLDSIVNGYVIIYRWKVHGSRNLGDCTMLREQSDPYYSSMTKPHMIFHDQEPLNFDYYENSDYIGYVKDYVPGFYKNHSPVLDKLFDQGQDINLKILCRPYTGGLHDKVLLVHSELNSNEVTKYNRHGFVTVYWWANALIARDWYRYAKIDPKLKKHFIKKDFLYYSRAWGGTREYRLKFTEMLINSDLHECARIKFGFTDSNTHYCKHQFHNPQFELSRFDFENFLIPSKAPSNSSADYDDVDYRECGIDIVAETLFDDYRHHLTEKILRPIACGKPFILLSTPGSLNHLKSYGFKTFDKFWDETYDDISDPVKRMEMVIKTMMSIQNLTEKNKNAMYKEIKEITDYNQQLFFSDKFFESLINEFKTNFLEALDEVKKSKQGKNWLRFRKICATDADVKYYITHDNEHYTKQDTVRVFKNLHATKKPA